MTEDLLQSAESLKASLEAEDLTGEKATTSAWVVFSGDIDWNRGSCGANAKLHLERWKDFQGHIPSLLVASKTFSEKEIFTYGVLWAEFSTLLVGPIMQVLAELPKEVACVYSKDLETHVATQACHHRCANTRTRSPSGWASLAKCFHCWCHMSQIGKFALAEAADRVGQAATVQKVTLLLAQHVGEIGQQDIELVPFDPDVLKALSLR